MTIAPSFTWGSSTKTTLTQSAPMGSLQLAQVSLPEPAVCSLYFQATVTRNTNPLAVVRVFTLNLFEGVGRVVVPRTLSYLAQPASNSPLEITIPFVPVHALNVNVDITTQFQSLGDELDVETFFLLSPITRIKAPQDIPFGMALPGEADAMDDEMRAELEAEAPSVQEIMESEAHQREHGGELEHDEPEHVELTPRQRMVAEVIDILTSRLGRRPKRAEVVTALQRIDQRNARRLRRQRA